MSPDPFFGVDATAQTTVFYRTTSSGVEGFVVDNDLLLRTMKERVLDERGLSKIVDVEPTILGSLAREMTVQGRAYHHQFSDPLATIEATLRLSPLELPVSEQVLLPLTLLVGGLVILGLFVLYRLSKTQVEFAEKQSDFVSAVTHELKTPLTAIRLHGEMLKEGLVESPQKAQEYYGTITTQAERLSRLISNVLWISDVERSPGSAPQRGSLKQPVLETVQALGPHVDASGFELVLDLPQDIPTVLLDRDSVEQILFNLVENATKYAKNAEDRRITVGVEVKEEWVELYVRDRGPGVPPELARKIFQPFFRGERELTRTNPGSGLGLSLVELLARQMGAQVEARHVKPGASIVVSFSRTTA